MAIADIIILGLAILLYGFSGGFLAKAAYSLGQDPQISTDVQLSSARTYLIFGSVLSFITLFLVVIILVLHYHYGERADSGTPKYILLGLTFLTLILIFVAGIIAAIGASKMKSSGSYSSNDHSAYGFSITSAIFLFGSIILLLIYMVILFLRHPPSGLSKSHLNNVLSHAHLSKLLGLDGSHSSSPTSPSAQSPISPVSPVSPTSPSSENQSNNHSQEVLSKLLSDIVAKNGQQS